MYFLIADDNLLDKYNTVWEKGFADIKNQFDSKLAYNKNYFEIQKNLLVILTIKKMVR